MKFEIEDLADRFVSKLGASRRSSTRSTPKVTQAGFIGGPLGRGDERAVREIAAARRRLRSFC
jgi:hypothetical protein